MIQSNEGSLLMFLTNTVRYACLHIGENSWRMIANVVAQKFRKKNRSNK
jgi:hypothetical protein